MSPASVSPERSTVFERPRLVSGGSARELALMPTPEADRPVPPQCPPSDRGRGIVILAGSAVLHSSLFVAFAQVPPTLPSIGIPTISVEIVLGRWCGGGSGGRRSAMKGRPSTSRILGQPIAKS